MLLVRAAGRCRRVPVMAVPLMAVPLMAVALVAVARVIRVIRRAAVLAMSRFGARCRARRCRRAVAVMFVPLMVVAAMVVAAMVVVVMVVAVMVVVVARVIRRTAVFAMAGRLRFRHLSGFRRARLGDLHQLRRRLVRAVAALAVLTAAARRPWARAAVRFRIVWQTFVGHRRLHLRGSCPLYRASPYRKVKLCVFAP
ncbi:MAG: hypothetical protein O3C09_02445 [Proteobacteria bacterium]|nr:hypothetical protein [Pseudomonadota bacterium]